MTTEALALLAITLGLLAWSVLRLLVVRFPHPCDLAALSAIYYTLPLAVVALALRDDAGLVFLHAAAADHGLALRSIYCVIVAVGCLHIGRLLGERWPYSTPRLMFLFERRDASKVSLFLLLLLAQLAAGIALFGTDAILAGYATESTQGTAATGNALLYAGVELIGLTIAYAYLLRRSTGARPSRVVLGGSVALVILLIIVRGKRLEIVAAFLPLVLLLFGTHPAFRSATNRLKLMVAAAFAISVLASLRLGLVPEVSNIFFDLVSEGLFAGHSLPGTLERLQDGQIGYEYGSRLLSGLLAFVPRFLWAGKDDFVYGAVEGLEGVNPLGATAILAEVYLQGGMAALVLFFLTLGFIFEQVHRFQAQFDVHERGHRLGLRTVAYVVIVATFIPHFRDGLVPAIKIALQSGAFMLLLCGLQLLPMINWRMRLANAQTHQGRMPAPR